VKGNAPSHIPRRKTAENDDKENEDFRTKFCGRRTGPSYAGAGVGLHKHPLLEMWGVRLSWAGATFDLPDQVCDVELEPHAAWMGQHFADREG
jgi:hypothetical protein